MGIFKKVLFALISSLALNIENVFKKKGGGGSCDPSDPLSYAPV